MTWTLIYDVACAVMWVSLTVSLYRQRRAQRHDRDTVLVARRLVEAYDNTRRESLSDAMARGASDEELFR